VEVRLLGPVEVRWSLGVSAILGGPELDGEPIAAVRAGADGAYRVTGLATGSHEVLAVARDGARASARVAIQVDGTIVRADLDLVDCLTLEGRAVWSDGRPFLGFVSASEDDEESATVLPSPSTRTDGSGRFALPGLLPGEITLTTVVPGRFRAMRRGIPVPYDGELELVVDAGAEPARGRVVADEDDRPVAGATVIGIGVTTRDHRFFVGAVTDEDGRFEVRLPPERRAVVVEAEGFAPSDPVVWEPGTDEVEVRLTRAATVSGRVTAKGDGRPVAGVTVRAEWVRVRTPRRPRRRPASRASTGSSGSPPGSGWSMRSAGGSPLSRSPR
jgi:hypothetical protein